MFDVVKRIMEHTGHPICEYKMDLLSEYGEFNHNICCKIMKILNEWDYDYNRDCNDEDYEAPEVNEKELRNLAQKIHNRGGLHTLQMNYYVMLHYLTDNLNTKRKVQQLQHIWNGVGDWVY